MKHVHFLLIALTLLLLGACATPISQPMNNEQTSQTCEQVTMQPKPAHLSVSEIEARFYELGFTMADSACMSNVDEAIDFAMATKVCLALYPTDPEDRLYIFFNRTSDNDLIPFLHSCERYDEQGGVRVIAVRIGSLPAQRGLLKGDVIRGINGVKIEEQTDLNPLFRYGADNTMEILRNGQDIQIKMFVPNTW